MTQLVEISAREFESRALESSRPSVSYVHTEAFGACRVQMQIMQQLTTMVEDDIDLYVLDDLKGNEALVRLGITHAPTLIFHKERVLCVIEGITPVETLIAMIKSHLGVDLSSRTPAVKGERYYVNETQDLSTPETASSHHYSQEAAER